MAVFEAWLVLLLVVNVVGELQQKKTLAASRGFLAAARLSCCNSGQLVITGRYACTLLCRPSYTNYSSCPSILDAFML